MKKYLYLLLYHITIILGVTILTGLYTSITSQMALQETASVIDLNTTPKTIYNKEVSVQKLMFLSGITVTTIGIIQIVRNQSFDHKSVDKSIALDPHRLLIVSGLSMLTISITIPL